MIEFWKRNAFQMLDIFMFDKALSKNKHMELQMSYYLLIPYPDIDISMRLNPVDTHFRFNFCNLIGFNITFSRQRDHAGLRIEIDTTPVFFIFTIYDIRHWNYDTNDYVNYDKGETNDDAAGKVDRSVSDDPAVQKRKRHSKKSRKKNR